MSTVKDRMEKILASHKVIQCFGDLCEVLGDEIQTVKLCRQDQTASREQKSIQTFKSLRSMKSLPTVALPISKRDLERGQ